jgi:hypothetical protein
MACVAVLSGCVASPSGSAAPTPMQTQIVTSLEGLPIPSGASLNVAGSYDGGGTQEWDNSPKVTLASVDDWYSAKLPLGRSWHDWQACPLAPLAGTINTYSGGTQRMWSKAGKLLVLATGSNRKGGGVRVTVAEFTPSPSPVGHGPC